MAGNAGCSKDLLNEGQVLDDSSILPADISIPRKSSNDCIYTKILALRKIANNAEDKEETSLEDVVDAMNGLGQKFKEIEKKTESIMSVLGETQIKFTTLERQFNTYKYDYVKFLNSLSGKIVEETADAVLNQLGFNEGDKNGMQKIKDLLEKEKSEQSEKIAEAEKELKAAAKIKQLSAIIDEMKKSAKRDEEEMKKIKLKNQSLSLENQKIKAENEELRSKKFLYKKQLASFLEKMIEVNKNY